MEEKFSKVVKEKLEELGENPQFLELLLGGIIVFIPSEEELLRLKEEEAEKKQRG